MKAEDLKSLRTKTITELESEVRELKAQLFKLRFQLATNQLDNPVKIREVKRDIARVKTLIKEKELNK